MKFCLTSFLAAFMCVVIAPAMATAEATVKATAEPEIKAAQFTDPTDRYAHGVLGDAIEWGGLEITLANGVVRKFLLPDHLVFEDLEPRLHDLDGDHSPEIIVVLSHAEKGAALAVFNAHGLLTQTPHIGTKNRWLAPIGAGELYGDGDQIVAYIDRPHLLKTLRLWRFTNGKLAQGESLAGLTNHSIGDNFIVGGIRNCGQGDEIVTVDGTWQNIMLTRTTDGGLVEQAIAPYVGRKSIDDVLACKR